MPLSWLTAMENDGFTHALIGAAIEVHKDLGPGFVERAYQRALELELGARGIPFATEVPLPVRYKGCALDVVFRADLVAGGRVILELKALPAVGARERRQLAHYLKSAGIPVGLVLNFGEDLLHVERVAA